jgi:TonB family protein
MKTKLTLLISILFFAAAVKAQTPAGVGSGIGPGASSWPRYTVKGEEFSIVLPTLPSMVTRKAPLAGTNKNRKERVLKATAGSVDYSIYIYENPKPRQSLDDFIREQTASSTRDVMGERTLTIDGCAGKEYSYRVNNKPATEQFFVAQKRLYRFIASGAPADHPGVERFFSSLAFGNKREGFEVKDGPGKAFTGDSPERYYTGREVDTKARLISKTEPVYTASAKEAQIAGTVVLKVVLSSNGYVTNIRVVQGLPYGLTEQAIAAARKLKFVPAMKDGKNVSMWIQLEYNFNLY